MPFRLLPWPNRVRLIRILPVPLIALAFPAAGLASPPAPEPDGPPIADALPADDQGGEAADVHDEPAPAGLEDLLSALDSPSFAERRLAQEALLDFLLENPQAVPHVEAAARTHPSLEVRSRCEAVLGQISQEQAFGATRVTIDVRDVTLAELVEKLSEVTGVRFRIWPEHMGQEGATGRVNFAVEDVPFWRMLAELERQTDLSWMEHHQTPGGVGAISLMAGQGQAGNTNWARLPTVYEGAFAVQLGRMWRHEQISIVPHVNDEGEIEAHVQAHGNLQMELRLLAEPKIRRAGMVRGPILDELTDDAGRDLRGQFGSQQPVFRGGTSLVMQSQVQLDPKAWEKATRIAVIRGRFDVEVATQTQQASWSLAEVIGRAAGAEGDADEPGAMDEDERDGGEDRVDPEAAEDGPGAAAGAEVRRGAVWIDRAADRVVQQVQEVVQQVDGRAPRALPANVAARGRLGGQGGPIGDAHFAGLAVGERVEIDEVLALGDHAVRLVSITRDGERQMTLELEVEGGDAMAAMQDWQRQQQLTAGLQLLDADGNAWDMGGGGSSVDGARLKLTRTFANWRGDVGPADRFVWEIFTRTSTMRIPFEFRDIPLPHRE